MGSTDIEELGLFDGLPVELTLVCTAEDVLAFVVRCGSVIVKVLESIVEFFEDVGDGPNVDGFFLVGPEAEVALLAIADVDKPMLDDEMRLGGEVMRD